MFRPHSPREAGMGMVIVLCLMIGAMVGFLFGCIMTEQAMVEDE